MSEDKKEYTISMQTSEAQTYEGGFADGYSRAWIECWEYMREKISEMKVDEEKVDE